MNNRNKALIITGVIIGCIGLILFIIGGSLEGWNFAEFIKSPTFVWICILIGIYVLLIIYILIKDWYDKL